MHKQELMELGVQGNFHLTPKRSQHHLHDLAIVKPGLLGFFVFFFFYISFWSFGRIAHSTSNKMTLKKHNVRLSIVHFAGRLYGNINMEWTH